MSDTLSKKRIAIIYLYPYIDSIPSLCNAARLLAQEYDVDIFTTSDETYVTPVFPEKNIHMFDIHRNPVIKKISFFQKNLNVKNRNIKACLSWIRIGLNRIDWIINTIKIRTLPLVFHQRNRQQPYCCIIGVDPEGVATAGQCASFIKVPVIYYSLELLLSNEIVCSSDKRLKKKERKFSMRSSFIIIQDKDRARLLSDDNEIPLDRFVFVPNSPLGSSERKKTGYWHNRFNLSPEKKIVLHTGSIGTWTGIDQIIQSVNSWPDNWVLIVHTRHSLENADEVADLGENWNRERVFFSLKPVSWKEYDVLVAGADIGIAFYINVPGHTCTQENIRSIGLSSGKIAYYVKSGLPVITNSMSSISDLIVQSECGIAVNSGEEIGNAIARISNDYDEYSRNALKFFDEALNFEIKFTHVVQRIKELDGVSDA